MRFDRADACLANSSSFGKLGLRPSKCIAQLLNPEHNGHDTSYGIALDFTSDKDKSS